MEEKKTNTDQEIKEPFKVKLKNYIKNIFDFSQYDKKTLLYIIILGIIVVFSVFLFVYTYLIDPTFLYVIVVRFFINPVHAIGFFGIFLFIGIMAIQGLIIPIPSEGVLLATGMIWGFFWGGIMGIIGSMAAGMLCFYLSRKGGRPIAEKFVGEKAIMMADNFIKKYGTGAIIVARLFPFLPFDPISYASGLVDLDVKKYAIGTFIGSIPRAFFYSILGASFQIVPPIDITDMPSIEAQSAIFNVILLIIVAVLGLMFILYYVMSKYYAKKNLNK